jgi:nucleoside-diphosphate-sugar epimerase
MQDKQAVLQTVIDSSPQVILHLAAVAPPDCYVKPELAYQVNVDGSKYLLDAAAQCPDLERFVFISSYSVHGPRNPNKEIAAIRAETPLNPSDNYARHKVIVETLVRESGLPWSILRLPAVYGLRPQQGGQAWTKYLFMLPPERRQHALDARDAGLALANAVHADILFRTLLLGGDAPDWMRTAGEFFDAIFQARGLKPLPDRYFRNPDPLIDEAWYYEDWVNTAESQLLLDYQKHSFSEYITDLSQQEKIAPNWLMTLMSPLVLRQLTKHSSFDRDRDSLDTQTHWEIVCQAFDIPVDQP